MKTLARLATVFCTVMLLMPSAYGQGGGGGGNDEPLREFSGPDEEVLSRPYLQGKWEGVMTGVGPRADGAPSAVPPFDPSRGQYGFRLEIRQTNLVMYFQNGDQWIPLGNQEGQDLRTNEDRRTAVVITALGATNGGIDTMMLNIVRWTEDSIAVHMSRVTGAGTGTEVPPPINSMGILNRANF